MTFDIAAHKNILIQILKDIYTDTTISPLLGFKGGTAAYMFYNLDRFSVDLDFDLLDESKEDYVFEKIQAIIKEYGKIKDARKKRFGIFCLLSYDDKTPNIKIEINKRSFGSKYEVKNYFSISVKVMVKEDMFANKLVAMMERMGKTNRDIYDVCFFLQNNWPFNKEIIEKRTNMPVKNFFKKCVGSLEEMSDRNILSGIGELLDPKQKIRVRSHLKKDTILFLKVRMESL